MPTTPTPGAVRAADRIALFDRDKERFARIIDEETHAPELLAALQAVVDNGGDLGAREWEACKAAITAATK